MKKIKKIIVSAICAALALCSFPMIVSADAIKVVTLGADLSYEQQQSMLRYFGVSADEVEIIYVNNNQERTYLGDYVPLEQIGYQTFSCSYVKPTTSGGIKVKTANLNWVTCNMIATTLSTCGVNNCQVIAASPVEVSGTGALTGIILAYQQASGTDLNQEMVDLANREMITTANLSDEIGQSNAIAVVNETKLEVIENNITNVEEITNIVNNISNEYNIEIENDQAEVIAELVAEIAQQDYEIEELKQNLASVQANVIGDTDAPEEVQEFVEVRNEEYAEEAQNELPNDGADPELTADYELPDPAIEENYEEENILDNTDSSALFEDGDEILESDTMSTVTEQAAAEESEEEDQSQKQNFLIYQGLDWNDLNWIFWIDEENDTAGLICQTPAEIKELQADSYEIYEGGIVLYAADGNIYEFAYDSLSEQDLQLGFTADSTAADFFQLYENTDIMLSAIDTEILSNEETVDGFEHFLGTDENGSVYLLNLNGGGYFILKLKAEDEELQEISGSWELNESDEFTFIADDGSYLTGMWSGDIYGDDYSITLNQGELMISLVKIPDSLMEHLA